MTHEWQEILYKASPQYTTAYRDGYEQARIDFLMVLKNAVEVLENMPALYDCSTATSINNHDA